MTMRLFPGLCLALALVLAGCGAETPDEPPDAPTPADASAPAGSPAPADGPVDFDQVAVVSSPAVGGVVAPEAVDLTDEAALAGFLGQFENGRMATALDETIAGADVAEGQTLVGAVVAIGCLPPTTVAVDRTDAGLEIVAVPDKSSPQVECLVPVTSVGVVAVDDSLV